MQYVDISQGQGSHEHEERISLREVELIKARDARTMLVFKLINGEEIEGVIRWYDNISVRITQPDRIDVTLFFHALMYYRASSPT